jgi:phage terminase small subunit
MLKNVRSGALVRIGAAIRTGAVVSKRVFLAPWNPCDTALLIPRQSGPIGAILARIDPNRTANPMSVKKPAALRRLEGNPGRRPIVDCGIEVQGSPFVPEHLPDDARGCIDVIKQSMPASVYSALDSFLLAAFGMAWALHKMAAIEISNPNFVWTTTNTKGTQVPSPWVKILNQQAQIMASLGDRLGLDPKSRAALKLPDARQKKSKFEGLIGPIYNWPLSN